MFLGKCLSLPLGLALVMAVALAVVAPATAADKPTKVLRHIVLYKFKDGLRPEQVQEVVDAFAALAGKIDTIERLEYGTNVSQENKSDGLTHCFLVTFRDEAGHNAYIKHPAHQQYVELMHNRTKKSSCSTSGRKNKRPPPGHSATRRQPQVTPHPVGTESLFGICGRTSRAIRSTAGFRRAIAPRNAHDHPHDHQVGRQQQQHPDGGRTAVDFQHLQRNERGRHADGKKLGPPPRRHSPTPSMLSGVAT